EADELRDFGSRDFKRFQEDPSYETFIQDGGTNVLYIEFAMIAQPEGQFGAAYKPPFDDIRVRQAVGYGINPDEMLDKVLLGIAQRNYGPMPSGLWAYKPEIEQFGFHPDPAKASALLDDAGWVAGGDGVREKDGKKLEVLFWTWNDANNEKCAQIIQNQLGQVGFKVNIQSLEGATMLASLDKNEHDFNFMSFSLPEPDVLRLITQYSWGLGRYNDEQFQDLVGQALKTTDQA